MIRKLVLGLALALGLAAFAAPAGEVRIIGGNVNYAQGDQVWTLVVDYRALEGALSPDGKSIAWIRKEDAFGSATGAEASPGLTSLHVVDRASRVDRLVLMGQPNDDLKQDFQAMRHPTWSLDGGFVYVMTSAWATSDAIHQINVRTGARRFVIDGNSLSVIRNGPYRGMLLVSRHLYHEAPDYGSYEPTFVVRPDGHVQLMVPGSDDDEAAVGAWLTKNGWEAW
jgi:hypothetical protein